MTDGYQQIDRKKELFSDFLTDLNSHPNTKDVVRFVDDAAIKRSIRNLLMTEYNERLYQPDLGSGIRRLLFEPAGPIVESEIKSKISDVINKYEPRCKVERIDVAEIDNGYRVFIVFSIINTERIASLEVSLYRVR